MAVDLVLIRHGHAEQAPEDRLRPLSARGRVAVDATGTRLVAQGIVPTKAWVSEATRARQTWDELAPHWPSLRPDFRPELYLAPPRILLRLLEDAGPGLLLIVGHNPGLSELAAHFDPNAGPMRPADCVLIERSAGAGL